MKLQNNIRRKQIIIQRLVFIVDIYFLEKLIESSTMSYFRTVPVDLKLLLPMSTKIKLINALLCMRDKCYLSARSYDR